VNDVTNVEEDGNGFFITGINTGEEQPSVEVQEELEEVYEADPADSYKHVAVVDCAKAFSPQECALISEKQNSISYLNVGNQVQFKFDSMLTSHGQVKHLTDRLVHKFLHPRGKQEKDKVVMNMADAFNSNNNAGFNLTNFKVKFINEFFQEVVSDYEKSLIGTFSKALLDTISNDPELKESLDVYFTITKFENDYGFSLIH
jgi:hypothetical protein